MKETNNRRNFIRKAILSGLGIGTMAEATAKEEPVKLLDPDGNLVEVDPDVLKNSRKKKVRNIDIIAWSKSILK